MFHRLIAALFALHVLVAPQRATEPQPAAEGDILTMDGAQVNSAVLSMPMLDIFFNVLLSNQLSNLTMPDHFNISARQPRQQRVRRQLQLSFQRPEMISAEEAAKIKTPSKNRNGIFYRGDSRPQKSS